MFTATGIGVRKNADNTVTVKAQIVDDRNDKVMSTREYTAPTVMAAILLVRADLQVLLANENDATLNAAIVGQVLGSV